MQTVLADLPTMTKRGAGTAAAIERQLAAAAAVQASTVTAEICGVLRALKGING